MTNRNPSRGGSAKLVAALAVTATLFVPLAVFGAPALARSAAAASQYQYSGASQYQYKVAVCHHTHSASHPWVQISVASAGWLHGHSKHHGDFLITPASPCPPATTPSTIVAPVSHGHSNDSGHGKNTHGSSSGATQGSSNHGKGNDAHGGSSATQGSNNSATQGTSSASRGSSDAHGNGNDAHGNDHTNGNSGNGNAGNGNGGNGNGNGHHP